MADGHFREAPRKPRARPASSSDAGSRRCLARRAPIPHTARSPALPPCRRCRAAPCRRESCAGRGGGGGGGGGGQVRGGWGVRGAGLPDAVPRPPRRTPPAARPRRRRRRQPRRLDRRRPPQRHPPRPRPARLAPARVCGRGAGARACAVMARGCGGARARSRAVANGWPHSLAPEAPDPEQRGAARRHPAGPTRTRRGAIRVVEGLGSTGGPRAVPGGPRAVSGGPRAVSGGPRAVRRV